MDYKYIEQLLERYWQCETTTEEENILRAFFAQPNVPANMARYKALFVYEQQQAADGLGENFDERLCQLAGVEKKKEVKPAVVRAKRISFAARLQPLYRAVAVLAVVVVIGRGVQYVFDSRKPTAEWDYNPANYKDSYNNPKEAYESLSDGIEELKDVLTAPADSAKNNPETEMATLETEAGTAEAEDGAVATKSNNNVRP